MERREKITENRGEHREFLSFISSLLETEKVE
jgi:hypothetical protein